METYDDDLKPGNTVLLWCVMVLKVIWQLSVSVVVLCFSVSF